MENNMLKYRHAVFYLWYILTQIKLDIQYTITYHRIMIYFLRGIRYGVIRTK
jgi:hypothetical protein